MRGKAPQQASLAQVFPFPFPVWSDMDFTVTWSKDFLPYHLRFFCLIDILTHLWNLDKRLSLILEYRSLVWLLNKVHFQFNTDLMSTEWDRLTEAGYAEAC